MRKIAVLLAAFSIAMSLSSKANADETLDKQLNTAVLQVEGMS